MQCTYAGIAEAGSLLGSRWRDTRRRSEGEGLDADARTLRPRPARVMRDKGPVGLDGPDGIGTLKVAAGLELLDALARLVHELTVGVLLEKQLPGLGRIRVLGRAPVLLLLATGSRYPRQHSAQDGSSCPECDHGRHP